MLKCNMASSLHGAAESTVHGSKMGPSEILTGKLFLGPAPTSEDTLKTLHRAGVSHICNCTKLVPFPTAVKVPGLDGKVL